MSIDDASHYDTERKYYDVIIVGGGAAGCVLAARLSEDPKRRVLLLESGGADTDPAISAPHGAFAVQSGAFNWSDLVDPAYLTDEADASRLIEGVRRALDPELRVHGVRGLYVADASIMPDIVRGNTHATAVMIGERAAELIG